MSNDGVQIEIPTFDDEPDSGLFAGKGAFGGGGGGFGGAAFLGSSFGGATGGLGFGSPANSTSPFGGQPESFGAGGRSQGGFHTRGDSATSDLSSKSFQFGGSHLRQNNSSAEAFATSGSATPTATIANAAPNQNFPRTPSKSSLVLPTTTPTQAATSSSTGNLNFPSRKHSFASIRNAFKSSKSSEPPPPMPALDHAQVYPALRNPFSRSVSSLSHNPPVSGKEASRKQTRNASATKSPGQSYSARFIPQGYNRTRSNSQAASAHSHSSSVAHSEYSDGEGSPSLTFDGAVPPVPRVPNQYDANVRKHRPAPSALSDVGASMLAKPQKPHEYAIHVLFTKFVTCAEKLVELFLKQSLSMEPLLTDILGSSFEPKSEFGVLLGSLAQLARKHAHPVIDSIMRWKNAHREQPLNPALVDRQTMHSRDKFVRPGDVAKELVRRKELATIYIMCKSLVVIMRSVTRDGLEVRYGDQLEATFFDEFVSDPDLKLLSHSVNHRVNAELYAMILGEMANVRFVSVTDRFISVLQPLAAGQVLKDGDMRFENIIRGLEFITFKVYPSDVFEEAAEFLEALSKSFANAHGQRLKSAFAEVLTRLLHPIAKGAAHEVNHPMWTKAIELMYPKANQMSKPRYWSVAFPLAISLLSVAPHDYFRSHWVQCVEMSMGRLKEKTHRLAALNGILRLVWTYLYRSQEPASTTTSKLDTLLKHFFPPKWRVTYPFEEGHDSLAYIIHYMFCRHPAYGRDTVLDLMQEHALQSLATNITLVSFAENVPVDRFAIAVRATLLSFGCMEKESTPSWPLTSNFFTSPLVEEDLTVGAGPMSEAVLSKPGMQEFFDRVAPAIMKMLITTGLLVGGMITSDPRYRLQSNLTYEEREDLIIRQHRKLGLSVAFHEQFQPAIETLRTCIESLPRCVHPSANLTEILDLLIRSVMHVEPRVGDEAEAAIHRFAASDKYVRTLVARLTRFLFAAYNPIRDTGPLLGSATQQERLVTLWASVLVTWSKRLNEESPDAATPDTPKDGRGINIAALVRDIEAGALSLLTSIELSLRIQALEVLRTATVIHKCLVKPYETPDASGSPQKRIIDILEGMDLGAVSLPDQNLPVNDAEFERLTLWREMSPAKVVCLIAEGTDEVDNQLWRFILPSVVRACMAQASVVLLLARDIINASVLRYHPLVSGLAQIQIKGPATSLARSPPPSRHAPTNQKAEYTDEVDQWKTWIVVLCASARDTADIKSPTKDHARLPSDPSSQRDRLSTPRGLLRHLIPFLMAEEPRFRAAVIQALGCIHQSAYRKLLEDLQSITKHIYDDARAPLGQKAKRSRSTDRLYTAVVQVYRLTCHYAKEVKTLNDPGTLNLLLQFVRESKAYLSDQEVQIDGEALRVRRFFFGVVEMVFSGMSTLPETQNLMSTSTRLGLFRLCQEWCAFGLSPAQRRRYDDLLSGANSNGKSPSLRSFENHPEAYKLSKASAAAMTALCSPSFFALDLQNMSPGGPDGFDLDEPLEVSSTIDWLSALFRDGTDALKLNAKRALRTLLTGGGKKAALIDEVLRRAFYSTDEPLENREYFRVVADLITQDEEHGLDFSQAACFALSNLCSPYGWRRGRAFSVLEKVARLHSETLEKELAKHEAAVQCPDAATYVSVQQHISSLLAEAYRDESHAILAQCALRLPQTQCQRVFMLRSLEPWMEVCTLTVDSSGLSSDGQSSLVNLFALTVHYADVRPEDVQSLWQKLTIRPLPHHTTAIVKFLLQQSVLRGSPEFLQHAQRVLAGLSRTEVGSMIYEELCSVIDSIGELATGPLEEIRGGVPDISTALFTSSLNSLITARSRLSLSMGQAALILISEMTVERPWDFQAQLPTILHAIFTHLDHSQAFMQQLMQNFLFRIIWSWLPGYDEIPETPGVPRRKVVKASVQAMFERRDELFWVISEGDAKSSPEIVRRIRKLCGEVIALLEPLFPHLRQTWGELAIRWVSQCPIPNTARRSIQILRAILPDMKLEMVASVLHRLSNIVSDSSKQIQAFAREILLTIRLVARSPLDDLTLFPSLWWSATALLSTTIEAEFLLSLEVLDALMDKAELMDEETLQSLEYSRPEVWSGDDLALQRLVIAGLRSSNTCFQTFDLLKRLAKLPVGEVIDFQGDRLRYMYTAALPWFLEAMETKPLDPSLAEFALDLAAIAATDDRDGIQRIMTSFAKSRFRTKEDFLRQAVGCLREYFMAQHSTEVITILLGLVLNSVPWIRIKSMQILKLVFGHAETRDPLILHGSDLLMPLLRLLNTEHAQQALEVLDEPLAISGGPSAAQVLRMSMHVPGQSSDADGEFFGVPSEAGWCIAKPEEVKEMCRHNILTVYTSFQHAVPPSGPISMVMFEEEEDQGQDLQDGAPLQQETVSDGASVANLVNTLHDLGEFFQTDHANQPTNVEERVAMILNRSLARAPAEQTFADVQDISMESSEWTEGGSYAIPGTPGPFAKLFSSPQNTMDNLHMNFGADSDDEDPTLHGGRLGIRQTSSPRPYNSSDEDTSAFAYEDGSFSKRHKSIRNIIGSKLSVRNGKPERRRL